MPNRTRLLITLLAAAALPLALAGVLAYADPTEPSVNAGIRLAPKAFRAAVDHALPSIVVVEVYGGSIALGPAPARPGPGGRPGPRPGPPPGPGAKPPPGGPTRIGEGPSTGVIVSPEGHVVTSTFNLLSIDGYERLKKELGGKDPTVTVTLSTGKAYLAKILGRDETRKLCLLKIEPGKDEKLPVAEFATPNLAVGQWAITVGAGYGGDEPAISAGIVSALNRISGKAIQTDANISPANYGGPLVDIEGRVIGICVPLSPQGNAVEAGVDWYDSGIGFAIPLYGREGWLATLKAGKTIIPGRLGIQVGPPTGGAKEGVTVTALVPTGAAAKAGLQRGDLLLKVDGQTVVDMLALRALVGRFDAGDEATLTIKRGGKEMEVKVRLEAGGDDMPLSGLIPTTLPTTRPSTRPGPGPEWTPAPMP